MTDNWRRKQFSRRRRSRSRVTTIHRMKAIKWRDWTYVTRVHFQWNKRDKAEDEAGGCMYWGLLLLLSCFPKDQDDDGEKSSIIFYLFPSRRQSRDSDKLSALPHRYDPVVRKQPKKPKNGGRVCGIEWKDVTLSILWVHVYVLAGQSELDWGDRKRRRRRRRRWNQSAAAIVKECNFQRYLSDYANKYTEQKKELRRSGKEAPSV